MNIIHTATERRKFLTLMVSLACMPLIPSCIFKAQPIKLGLHVWPGYEPIPLAKSMGWLDEKQVKIIQTDSATDSLKLLKEGKIDGAGLTLDEVLRARENGIQLSVILVCDISAGADQFLVRPEIKTLFEIKGRRSGVEDGALGALMLNQVLEAAHLKIEDIQPISLSIDQHVDAWKSSVIDAVVTYEPASSKIWEMGAKRLFDSSMIPNVIVDVLAVRSSLLDYAHSDALRHLVTAHLKALKYLNTNSEDAAYSMAPHLKLPPDQVMSSFRGLVLPDAEINIRLLDTSNPALLKSAYTVSKIMLKAGILHKQADMTGLLHPEYLPKGDS